MHIPGQTFTPQTEADTLRRSAILAYTWYYIESSKLASEFENSSCITDNGILTVGSIYADGGLVEIRPTYHVVAPRPLKL